MGWKGAALLLMVLAACSRVHPAVRTETPRVSVPPSPCTTLEPGVALQARIDAAPDGSNLCLSSGVYAGPVTLDRGITLWGPREAEIRSSGVGTTVRLQGKGARLLGLTVNGSGGRYDTLDAAVHVQGEGLAVEDVSIHDATFGILVELSKAATIRGNHVRGSNDEALGLRGDLIRLWETNGSVVEGNVAEHGRDVVVWYSSDNRITGNLVEDGRYGTHLMYSHRNLVADNRYLRCVVGVFLMYSRDVRLERNLVADAGGAAGMGIGVKESGNLTIKDNRLLRNTVGAYLDSTPLQKEDVNVFEGNIIRLSRVGVQFHGLAVRNHFRGNVFKDDVEPVQVDGGDDAMAADFDGNDFDDYAGYDMDGDGTGDVPYELRSLSADLVSRYPELEFLRGTPALALVNVASEVLPLLTPKPILRDPRPRMDLPME